jgi:pimeloyl-ACP methyl ester carboxylesterase
LDKLMDQWWQTTFPKGKQMLDLELSDSKQRFQVAYGEKGSGQPVFLLHGIGSWSYSWRYSVDPLSQHFRVICLDATGHGFSPPSPCATVSGHQAIELQHIVQTLANTQPAVLIGESLGALTALLVAQKNPSLIERLVLINIPIFPRQLPSTGMRLLASIPIDLVRWFDQRQLVRPFAPIVRQVTRILREEVVFDPNTITDEEIYWLTYPYIHFPGTISQFALNLQQGAQEIDRLYQNQPNLITSIQQSLDTVTQPTLILWGEQDRWFPVEDGKQLCDRLPHAQLEIIPRCGHNASSSNPDAINDALVRFLVKKANL